MRQVILYIATSLDNYIARSDGDVGWLDDPDFALPGEDYGYAAFYKSIDTTLMGNNTYKLVLGFGVPFPYPDKTNYVFTRSTEFDDTEFVKFITDDPVEFVRKLKQEEGQDIWLVGGGQINSLLLNHLLIDKIILTLIPIILGEGVRIFDGKTVESGFSLETSQAYKSGFVQLTYIKRRQVRGRANG
jgi:dihydrofolate reductase